MKGGEERRNERQPKHLAVIETKRIQYSREKKVYEEITQRKEGKQN